MEKTKKLSISIENKVKIIEAVNEGVSYPTIIHDYGLNSSSNISMILKNKEKYLAAYKSSVGSPLRRTLKECKYKHIDEGLRNFIAGCCKIGVAINDNILRVKAIEIAKVANIAGFKSSSGYLDRFKKRNAVTFIKIHGEAGGVDENIISLWFSGKLQNSIQDIDPDNIFNGDELGLLWRIQPSATYTIKDSVCKLGKQSKERMTIFLAANMSGTFKLPILVIGKSENPRKFNLVRHLNLMYYHNSTAWMNGSIFINYLEKINSDLVKQKRMIILFIDNCSAHPQNIKFSNITVKFLPPNTTSVLQPMDAGIIKCFKGIYKLKLAQKLIRGVDTLELKSVAFHEAVIMAFEAWGDLNSKTITNCFRHCGFYRAKCITEEIIDPEYDEFNLIKS